MGRNRTKALGKLYKKITNTELPTDANTTTEALQKVYEALTNDNKHHINVTDIIEDLATNWSGGGGGGSSDFSTAKVTVINNTNIPVQVNAPFLLENGEYKFSTYSVAVEPGTGILNVVLFFGECVCFVDDGNFSVSGDAELEGTEIIITGDCTITISAPTPN